MPQSRPAPARALPAAKSGSAAVISIRDLKAHCSTCSLRELCLPVGLDAADLQQVDAVVSARQKIRKGGVLYRAGDPFDALYALRVGSLKTTILAEDGREQVAGFHLQGDLVGLDGVGNDRHSCSAIVLEDTEVCVLPFARIEELSRAVPALQRNLHRFLAREITRDQSMMMMLGSMRAEERLAAFLQSVGERYHRRGYSSSEFILRMTREEIGSLLGLKLETVSRLFSRFQAEGLVRVQGRAIKILNPAALGKLIGPRG